MTDCTQLSFNLHESCKVLCKAADSTFSFGYSKSQVQLLSKFIRNEYRIQLYVTPDDISINQSINQSIESDASQA